MLTFEQYKKRGQKDPNQLPAVMILKRRGIRKFASGKTVAIYRIEELGIDVVFPIMFPIAPSETRT